MSETLLHSPSLKTLLNSDFSHLNYVRPLTNLAIQKITLLGSFKRYKVGENILDAGAEAAGFGIIQSGYVEGLRYSEEQNESIVALFRPGDAIGLGATLQRQFYTESYRAAHADTQIHYFCQRPTSHYETELKKELNDWIRSLLLNHERILSEKINILNAGSTEQRLLKLFENLANRFRSLHRDSNSHPGYSQIFPYHLTRSQAARLIQARTETVIRISSLWQESHFVLWTHQGIWINCRNSHEIR